MIKTWLLKWLVGSTTAASLLSPQITPSPPLPPQIIETPVYISDNSATNEALSGFRSAYERKIQILTDKISKLEGKIEELEKRPPIVEKIIASPVPSAPPAPSSPSDITNIVADNLSRFDKRLASLEGRVGLYETSYIQLNDAYKKIGEDVNWVSNRLNTADSQVKRLCSWLANSVVLKPLLPLTDDLPRCQGLWW